MTRPLGPIWVVDISTSPAARAGLESLLNSDPTIWLWNWNVGLNVVARSDDGSVVSPPAAPNIIAVVMATDALVVENALSRWEAAGLVMIGGDRNLANGIGAERSLALLDIDVESNSLMAAVHAVSAGLTVVDPKMLDQERGIFGGLVRPATDDSSDVLTPREREVLALVAVGLPNKTIAMELGISEHTAKFHVGSLLSKLGAASRTEAVTLAARRGILII